jgi:hypothetical protein
MQELRSLLQATSALLAYHNQQPINKSGVIEVVLTGSLPEGIAGQATVELNQIELKRDLEFSHMATVVIHELIHLYFDFKENEEEKLTSTLTSKIKADVIRMANVLSENTQQRAAYIAHTKLAYRPGGSDFYDKSQFHDNHSDSAGSKYRKCHLRPAA